MTVETVGVIGAGAIGGGIAQTFGMAGRRVPSQDLRGDALFGALPGIGRTLERLAANGRVSAEDAAAALARIKTAMDLARMEGLDDQAAGSSAMGEGAIHANARGHGTAHAGACRAAGVGFRPSLRGAPGIMGRCMIEWIAGTATGVSLSSTPGFAPDGDALADGRRAERGRPGPAEISAGRLMVAAPPVRG